MPEKVNGKWTQIKEFFSCGMDVRKKSSQKVSKKTHCFDVKANKYNIFYAQNQIMEEYRKKSIRNEKIQLATVKWC